MEPRQEHQIGYHTEYQVGRATKDQSKALGNFNRQSRAQGRKNTEYKGGIWKRHKRKHKVEPANSQKNTHHQAQPFEKRERELTGGRYRNQPFVLNFYIARTPSLIVTTLSFLDSYTVPALYSSLSPTTRSHRRRSIFKRIVTIVNIVVIALNHNRRRPPRRSCRSTRRSS
jgi:hypothetical protein